MTVSDAARRLEVSHQTIRNYIDAGRLLCTQEWRGEQRRIYVYRSDVERLAGELERSRGDVNP